MLIGVYSCIPENPVGASATLAGGHSRVRRPAPMASPWFQARPAVSVDPFASRVTGQIPRVRKPLRGPRGGSRLPTRRAAPRRPAGPYGPLGPVQTLETVCVHHPLDGGRTHGDLNRASERPLKRERRRLRRLTIGDWREEDDLRMNLPKSRLVAKLMERIAIKQNPARILTRCPN